jgi:hypothetical protein
MMHRTIISIDPGASGAVVIRSSDGPILEVAKFEGWETVHRAIVRATRSPSGSCGVAALIERVWASPVMGVSSAFAFGENYGTWIGALRASAIKVYSVTPQTWQKSLRIEAVGPARKAALCAAAKVMFPGEKVTLKTADALLISEYAHQQNQNHAVLGELSQ